MTSDFARVDRAIRYLVEHASEQPTLAALASHLDLSPFHVQRLFHRWAGVTPKDFVQAVTLRRAKEALAQAVSLLDASREVGLSGPSRLHDLFLTHEAMTPGEFKAGAAGMTIDYGVHETPFGDIVIALNDRGICGIFFVDDRVSGVAEELRRRWPEARFRRDLEATRVAADEIRRRMLGTPRERLHVAFRGTPFQVKVWEALLVIPEGRALSYQGLASFLGAKGASRAVGTAVGQNPIAYLIPCHRVLKSTGAVGEYRWGTSRKHGLLALESVRAGGASQHAEGSPTSP